MFLYIFILGTYITCYTLPPISNENNSIVITLIPTPLPNLQDSNKQGHALLLYNNYLIWNGTEITWWFQSDINFGKNIDEKVQPNYILACIYYIKNTIKICFSKIQREVSKLF